jgi:hypothetical protein
MVAQVSVSTTEWVVDEDMPGSLASRTDEEPEEEVAEEGSSACAMLAIGSILDRQTEEVVQVEGEGSCHAVELMASGAGEAEGLCETGLVAITEAEVECIVVVVP